MIMKRPPSSADGSGLMAPFTTSVWLLILLSLLTVGPLIYGLIVLRYKLTKDRSQQTYPMPHCVWFVYGALMKQGSTLAPVASSTRLIFSTWWIFITILTSFYTANLTAFLTLSKFTLPIKKVDDLISKDKEFVAHRGSCIEYAITNVCNFPFFPSIVCAKPNWWEFSLFSSRITSRCNWSRCLIVEKWILSAEMTVIIWMTTSKREITFSFAIARPSIIWFTEIIKVDAIKRPTRRHIVHLPHRNIHF